MVDLNVVQKMSTSLSGWRLFENNNHDFLEEKKGGGENWRDRNKEKWREKLLPVCSMAARMLLRTIEPLKNTSPKDFTATETNILHHFGS